MLWGLGRVVFADILPCSKVLRIWSKGDVCRTCSQAGEYWMLGGNEVAVHHQSIINRRFLSFPEGWEEVSGCVPARGAHELHSRGLC